MRRGVRGWGRGWRRIQRNHICYQPITNQRTPTHHLSPPPPPTTVCHPFSESDVDELVAWVEAEGAAECATN